MSVESTSIELHLKDLLEKGIEVYNRFEDLNRIVVVDRDGTQYRIHKPTITSKGNRKLKIETMVENWTHSSDSNIRRWTPNPDMHQRNKATIVKEMIIGYYFKKCSPDPEINPFLVLNHYGSADFHLVD